MSKDWRALLIAAARRDMETRGRLAAEGTLFDGYHPQMEAVHAENVRLLEHAIDDLGGWPMRSRLGDDGAGAAFLIAQHAIAFPAFQRRALTMLLEAVEAGEINPVDVAYLSDRIAVFEGRGQVFGTQFDWDQSGRMAPAEIVEPEQVDERRASVGLGPLADAVSEMRARAAAEGGRPPADLEKRRAEFDAWARRVGWRA